MKSYSSTFLPALTAGALLCFIAPAIAFEPGMVRLQGKNKNVPNGYRFGTSVAMSDRWIVVGEPNNDEAADGAGAVHVFEAATRKHVLRLLGPADPGAMFGDAVAVSGDYLAVGASVEDTSPSITTGACYIFQLPSGKLVRKIVPAEAEENDRIGCSVGIDGRHVAIGAFLDDDAAAEAGAIYVYDIHTGAKLWKSAGADSTVNSWFGKMLAVDGGLILTSGRVSGPDSLYLLDLRTGVPLQQMELSISDALSSLALSGRRAMAGISGANDGVASGGAVAVFDCDSGTLLQRFWPADVADGDSFGVSVALHGDLACIGARARDGVASNSGAVYMYDVRDFTQLAEVLPNDGSGSALFGNAVAMHGSHAIVGAYFDGQFASQAGAAYVIGPFSKPSPFRRIAAVNDSAPGIMEARHSSIVAPVLNGDGDVVFHGTLSGPGSTQGRNRGVWNTIAATPSLDLFAQSGVDLAPALPGVRMTSVVSVSANQATTVHLHARLAGAGVNLYNNEAILRDDGGSNLDLLLRTGTPVAETGGTPSRFVQVLQSIDASESLAVVYRLRQGAAGISATNDSGILRRNMPGGIHAQAREGLMTGAGKLGQINRASFFDDDITFSAPLQGVPSSANQALFEYAAGMLGTPSWALKKGGAAPGSGGALFSTFLGETLSSTEDVVVKASLSGAGVNAGNQQGLWSERFGSFEKVARAGEPAGPDAPGTVWRGFSKFWALAGDRVLFLASLRGTGVTAATDQVLALAGEDGMIQILLREGDAAPGCGQSKISVIQNVVAESAGNRYAVVASLTGGTAANQALLVGRTSLLLAKKALRRPYLAVRKGDLLRSTGGSTSTVRSISWNKGAFDATGAGGKGLGTPINASGDLALLLTMNDGSIQAVTWSP